MNRKRILTATLLFAVFALPVRAYEEPILLASFNVRAGLGTTPPPTDRRVAFVIGVGTKDTIGLPIDEVGDQVFWSHGSSGVVDFTAKNEKDFPSFASSVTDGANDILYTLAALAPGGGGGNGGGGFESDKLCKTYPCVGRPPDLLGYRLDILRLIVRSVDFERFEPKPGFFIDVRYDIAYEFYGTPIPEPHTLTLLSIAVGAWKLRMAKGPVVGTVALRK